LVGMDERLLFYRNAVNESPVVTIEIEYLEIVMLASD